MVQELINGIAGLATLEAVLPLGWQAAVGEYERFWPDQASRPV
jgi:hypothetical protein